MGKTKKDILDELEDIKQLTDIFRIKLKISEIQWAINIHLTESEEE